MALHPQEQEILKAASNPKLKDSNPLDIKKTLLYVTRIIGLKIDNILQVDLDILVDFLRTTAPVNGFTNEEIITAFKMVMAGEIVVKNTEHYQNLSVKYIGEIMQGYKEYKAKTNKKLISLKEKQIRDIKQLKSEPMTPKKAYEITLKKVVREKKIPAIWGWWLLSYDHAENEGLIKLTNEEKEAIKKLVILEKQQSKRHDITASQYLINDGNNDLVKMECRRRVIIDHFKKLII